MCHVISLLSLVVFAHVPVFELARQPSFRMPESCHHAMRLLRSFREHAWAGDGTSPC